MKNLLSRLPVGARLGLRDLTDNKAASVVLVVFLAIIIGVAMPLLLTNHTSTYASRAYQYGTQPEQSIYASPTLPGFQVQAIVNSTHAGVDNELEKAGLQAVQTHSANAAIPAISDPWWPECAQEIEQERLKDCAYSTSLTAANWSDPALAAQTKVLAGKLPTQFLEIAIMRTPDNPQELNAASVGESLEILVGERLFEYTVVGILDDSAHIKTHAIFGTNSFSPSLLTEQHLGLGPDLSDQQAYDLGLALNNLTPSDPWTFTTGWDDWNLRAFEQNSTLMFAAAKDYPIGRGDLMLNSAYETSLTIWVFIAVLLLITLLSVPMFWQNHKQKTMQELQLKRSGASAFQLSLMRVTPALVLGVSAAILGVLGSFAVMVLIGHNEFETSLWKLRLSVSVGFLIVVPLISGVAPALIASFLPDLTQRFSTYASIRFTAVRHRFDRPWSVVWPVFLLASAILVAILNALSANAKQESQLYAIYAVCGAAVLISAYWLYSWVFTRIAYATNASGAGSMSDVGGSRKDHRVFATSSDASSPPLALRIAAKELQLSSGSAINTCIPITVLTVIAGFATVSGQQHDFTYLGQGTLSYPYLDNFLPFSVMIGILILLLAYLVAAQTSTEIQNHRLALARHGMPQRHITAIDGYRALIVTALGGISGYLLGTLLGAFAMIGWVNGYENATFNFRSLLPDANILIAVIAPIALSYLAGKLAGTRHLARNEHLALRYSS